MTPAPMLGYSEVRIQTGLDIAKFAQPIEPLTVKSLPLIAFMFASLVGVAGAQPKPESVKQVVAIIGQFPKLTTFQRYRTLADDPAAAAGDPKAVAEARASLNFVRDSIPQLMQLLEPGTSVFDYPGLLAIGEVRHSYVGEIPDPFSPESETKPKPTKGYHIYYGAVGIEFRIEIDDRGSIVQVKKVVRPY